MSADLSHTHLRNLAKVVSAEDRRTGLFEATISTGTERSVVSSRAARQLGIRGREGRVVLSLPGTGCRPHVQSAVIDDEVARQYGDHVVVGNDFLDAVSPARITAKNVTCCRESNQLRRSRRSSTTNQVVDNWAESQGVHHE